MISKIAIFRALHLGDMLCIIPVVRAIRAAYPEAEIFLVGLPWQKEFVPRFRRYFDRFIEFPGWPGLPEQRPDASAVIDFLQQIRSFDFDLLFQMQGNGVLTNSMCMLWKGKKIYGLRREGEYEPEGQLFPISEDSDHEILRFFKLLDTAGIPRQGTHLEFPIEEQEEVRIKHILRESGLAPREYICIHPGARDPRRRWPIENFAHVANHMATRSIPVVLTGSMEEKSLLDELKFNIEAPVLNIVESFGHLTAGELASLLANSRLLVSNDTGVSHIAAALEVPSVILFSRYSAFERWRPLDIDKHIAIPYEKTGDPSYVIHIIMEALAKQPQRANRFTVG